MSAVEFAEATRLATNPLAGLERRCLVWMAGRLPPWVTSDRLTALALAAMALSKGRLFASLEPDEATMDSELRQVLVTSWGHWRGETLAVVEAA